MRRTAAPTVADLLQLARVHRRGRRRLRLDADQFQKDTGISVSYTADVNDNNEFFAKVNNQLGSCSSTKRDLFVLTDWMAARMIQVGWIQKLDAAKVPNLHANIIDSLKSTGWDPTATTPHRGRAA